jgi:hypothetical protein
MSTQLIPGGLWRSFFFQHTVDQVSVNSGRIPEIHVGQVDDGDVIVRIARQIGREAIRAATLLEDPVARMGRDDRVFSAAPALMLE